MQFGRLLNKLNDFKYRMKHPLLVIGHRGVNMKDEPPENSCAAFTRAIEVGLHGFELDVHLSHDGHSVVIHDDSVNRTTNGYGKVSDKTLEELRQYELIGGGRIPTLHEALNSINDHSTSLEHFTINIELKGSFTEYAVAKIIKEYLTHPGWGLDNFIISSFDYDKLKKFHNLMPDVAIGALWWKDKPYYSVDSIIRELEFNPSSIHIPSYIIDKEYIKDAHKNNIGILCWESSRAPKGSNKPPFSCLVEMGVDILVADNITKAAHLLNKHKIV